ncbi:archease [Candidatus Woesearchaeota archaeon]|nr:archease [Candidatus Woesearchaeota archaeon]
MEKFEFLEHTADAKFRAYGKSFEQAFANAAYAMVSLMYDSEMIAALKIEKIEVHGKDMEQLLYAFLEEILFLQDSKQFVAHEFVRPVKITGTTGKKLKLSAEIIGDRIKKEYSVRPVVKAVTYNEMKISEKPVYVQVVVDI